MTNHKQSKKNEQHIVPRTYLKHWKISEHESFVYGIDLTDRYNKRVQKFGLNHKVFKERKFYNHSSFDNPYIIEDVLGGDIEPYYDKIMKEVTAEVNLSLAIREMLISWLYVSQIRSRQFRNSVERAIQFINRTTTLYQKKNLSVEQEAYLLQQAKAAAKDVHIKAFAEGHHPGGLLSKHINILTAKSWRILKALPEADFMTNDNPGFSPNMIERFAIDNPYHAIMELNADSIIYFPLSPKYCLEISPFLKGTPLQVDAFNMTIPYDQASKEQIHFINQGVLFTTSKVIISNNKTFLKKFAKQVYLFRHITARQYST